MAGLKGDFAALREMAQKVKDLPTLYPEIAQKAAPGLRQSVQASVGNQVDPYGQAWPPFKTPPQGTAGYMNAISIAAEGNRIAFEVAPPVSYHHDGVPGHMPPRPVIPDEGRGIPPNMQKSLVRVAKAVISEHLPGGVDGGDE